MSKFLYYLLIPNLDDSKLMLVETESQWQLPNIESGIHYSECASFLIKFIKEMYNIEASIMGLLDFLYNEKTDTLNFYFIVETYSDVSCIQQKNRYFSMKEIKELSFDDSDQKVMVIKWFNEKESPASSQKPEWMKRGWLSSVVSWIQQHVRYFSADSSIQIEPVKLWYRGYVMRVNSEQEIFYFKAVPKGFNIENLLALDFSQQIPDNSPVIVAENIERGWILVKNIQGNDLMDIPDEAFWIEAVRAYARIQILYSTHIEELTSMGCMNRTLEKLPDMLKVFASEGLCMQPGMFGALTAEEISSFNGLIPQIFDDCKKLEKFGIPYSFEHGDLTPHNVKVTDNSVIFFDWSDCSVSHPFFSLRALFGMLEVVFPNNNTIRNRLRDAYVNEWESQGYGNAENLIEAFELADKLAPLHMSMTYHLQILPVIERNEECIGTESLFLRWLLKQYSEDKNCGRGLKCSIRTSE